MICLSASKIADRSQIFLHSLSALEEGSILSIHRHSFNILFDCGKIAAIHDDSAFFTPLSLLCGCSLDFVSSLEPGQRVFYEPGDAAFYCGNVRIETRGAVSVPCSFSPPKELSFEKFCSVLNRASGAFPPESENELDRAVYRICEREIKKFISSVRSNDGRAACNAAAGLVGLGKGLTPSGDDVLCGCCAVLRADARLRRQLESIAAELRELALKESTRLSAEFIACMTEGYYPPALCRMLSEAAQNNEAGCMDAAAEMSRMGSSSGRDHLFGVHAASMEWRNI